MYLLCQADMGYEDRRRVVNDFFIKMRVAKRELHTINRLNRFKRARCRSNLLKLEEIEAQFNRVEYIDDITLIYQNLSRYLYLSKSDLIDILADEEIRVKSLFL